MDAPLSFTVIGEAIIDLLPAAPEDGYLARPGGSPLNVAVGLARLGQQTALAARLSGDTFGLLLRRYLRESGIDLRHARTAPQPSTVALVQLSGGRARYQFSLDGPDFRWTPAELAALPGEARAVHFGSLASWQPPGAAAIMAAVTAMRTAGGPLISYDPNIRPSVQPDADAVRDNVEFCVARAHIVKASTDDVRSLYGSREPDAIARRWLDLGPGLVILTAGSAGATAWTGPGQAVSRPAYRAKVLDTVGAGDAFTSGLLDALARRSLLDPASIMTGLDASILAAVLDEASLVAGLTCQRPGAKPPRRDEVIALLSR